MAVDRTNGEANDEPSTAERVLDAALSSFAARGFNGTSLDDLAADLGIRKQTILYYHRTKDALLDAVVDRVVNQLVDAFDQAIAAGPADPDGRVTVVVDTIFRLGSRRPEVLALLWQVARLGDPAAGRLAVRVEPVFEHLVAYLAGPAPAAGGRARGGRSVAEESAAVRRSVLAASARVLALAMESELRRQLGIAPDLAWLRRRRADLIDELTTRSGRSA
ncbi:MAG TPA: TetR/AcrR family transcriptional regulator [Acidimicrobiales bacterium]|nr:TetR/AcrR family transcriptional regulator [Acidimicrobiales bacterium]